MTANTLSAHQVDKRYGAYQALNHASLEIAQGEILGLLGPNGAGKTTLIKILATLLRKDSGTVTILGRDIDRDPEAVRHRIGYVGQDTERSAYARLTAWENLTFFATLRGMTRAEIRARVDQMVDYFDFHDPMGKPFFALSGGQKQTVVIMRALLHNPPLVFLDEPTKGLDPLIARRIRAFLKRYAHEQGMSMLLTSHVLSEVDEMADQVALIQRGRIPITGTPAQLKAALGAQDFIELEKAHLTGGVIAQIQALDSVVLTFERDPGWLSFGVTDALRGAETVIQTLRKAGVQASFRHHTVTLEDAFLHHVGELSEKFDQ